MLQPSSDQKAFDPARTIKHGSQTSEIRVQGGNFEIVTLGFKTNVEPYHVERVIGVDPIRQFITSTAGGREQVHEVSYDPKSNQWFDVYGDEDRQPGEWGHWTGGGMTWNSMCAECHNTRLKKNFVESTDTYHTTMEEMSVGCEACHGPLKSHVDWSKAHPNTKAKDPNLPQFGSIQVIDTCGSCHSRRDNLTGDFKPGDSFHDHYSMQILDEAGRWYPDGQIKDEDYEYASFLSSRMHESGVSCRDCHDVHSAKTQLAGNDLCMRCHNGGVAKAPVISPLDHGHHKADGSGSACIGCHMPTTTYMQKQPRHDHGFTIPDPFLTKQLGIPNACNRCHTDKSVDWALENTGKWYGAKMNRHSRERAEWIAAAERGEDGAKDGLTIMLTGKAESPYWRAVAGGFLWQWAEDPDVKAALLKGLKDEDPLVREKVARSLEDLVEAGDTEIVTALKPLLDDPIRSVRVESAWALRATVNLRSRARGELLETFDLDSDQPKGQFRIAMFLLARQQTNEALTHLQKAVLQDSFSPPLRYETANLLSQLGRHEEAAEQLQVACRLQPQSADPQFKLGLEWAEMHNFEKAVEALERATTLDAQHVGAWYSLGLARDGLGKTTEALEALDRAENLSPNDPQVPFAEANILARNGRTAEARAAAKSALKLQANFKPAQEFLRNLPADDR